MFTTLGDAIRAAMARHRTPDAYAPEPMTFLHYHVIATQPKAGEKAASASLITPSASDAVRAISEYVHRFDRVERMYCVSDCGLNQ